MTSTAQIALLVCVIVGLAVGEQAADDERQKRMDAIVEECKIESGVPQELLDKMKNGVMTDNQKLRAHLVCVSQKYHYGGKDGEEKTKGMNVEPCLTCTSLDY